MCGGGGGPEGGAEGGLELPGSFHTGTTSRPAMKTLDKAISMSSDQLDTLTRSYLVSTHPSYLLISTHTSYLLISTQ